MNLSHSTIQHLKKLQQALQAEYDWEKQEAIAATQKVPLHILKETGKCWFPVMIKRTDYNKAEYLVIEIERPGDQNQGHLFNTGKKVRVFSKTAEDQYVDGTISKSGQQNISVSTYLDDEPDWLSDGKIGVFLLHDDFTYREAANALRELEKADSKAGKKETVQLLELLYGDNVVETHAAFDRLRPTSIPSLNEIQNQAVGEILAAERIFVLHGPPGTGKSTTLAQAIKATLETEKQVLYCAPSNTAVDVMTEKLMEMGVHVLRIGNPVKISPSTIHASLEYQFLHHEQFKVMKELRKKSAELHQMAGKYKRVFGKEEREHRQLMYTEAKKMSREVYEMEEQIERYLVDNAQVICCTPAMSNNGLLESRNFPVLFFDEATQATEPVFWIPALKAKKVVMAGDHLQLGPTVKSDEAKKAGLENSVFETAIKRGINSIMLEEQYRMHEHIMQFSGEKFYHNALRANAKVAQRTLESKTSFDQPFVFIDTAGSGYAEEQDGQSLSTRNPEEAQFVVSFLNLLEDNVGKHHSVGIITPYSAQVNVFKTLVDPERGVQINTVDGFQGQEKDIIIISCVRSNMEGQIGFLQDTRRMNVALTRARKKLVVVGDSATLGAHPFYQDLLNYAEKVNGYTTIWEFNF